MKKGFIILASCLTISTLFSCNFFDDEVTIIYTNDVHGEINQKLSYATAGQIKKDLQNQNKNVLLLDSGDHISGGFYTNYDQGKSMIECMSLAGYDASTLGNHEFDYNFDYLTQLIKSAKFPYIVTNLYHTVDDKPTERYTDIGSKIFRFNYVSVGVIGVATPESKSCCKPGTFDGYTFMEDQFYETIQKEIDSIKNECKYIVCMSHLGDQDDTHEFTSSKLAKNTTGINVILDGHTHQIVPSKVVKNKDNKDVVITQTGAMFKRIGKLTINNYGVKTELIETDDRVDANVKSLQDNVVKTVDDYLKEEIATTDIDFIADGETESNLGDLLTEAMYYYYNVSHPEETTYYPDLAIINSGAIRYYDIKERSWSLKTCRQIHPFYNVEEIVEITGEWLRNTLEYSCHKLSKSEPKYYQRFLEVCGVKFDVDTTKETDIQIDAVTGEYVAGPFEKFRLDNIQIYNRESHKYDALDLNRNYYITGSSFLLEGGDGYSMLKNHTKLVKKENVLSDYGVLVNYIRSFSTGENKLPVIAKENSPLYSKYPGLGIDYTNPGFGKRINITQ